VDWDGYTIGYYGRIFEARNKAKGGSFEVSSSWHLAKEIGSGLDCGKVSLGPLFACILKDIHPPEVFGQNLLNHWSSYFGLI